MTDDEMKELRRRLLANPPGNEPTIGEIRAMPLEALRDLFDRGGFPVTVTWDELMLLRGQK